MANGDLRLSIPGAGRTVAASAEERAVCVRDAVDIVAVAFSGLEIEADFIAVFGPRWSPGETGAQHDPVVTRAALAVINVWITAALHGPHGRKLDFRQAEEWFYGDDKENLPSLAKLLSADTRFRLAKALDRLKVDDDLLDLLPYVLEPHGPGSRLTVMKDPGTLAAWDAKRDDGVFYTPSDVADYMVATAADDLPPEPGPILTLDPSCGTGVYLVAMLRHAVAKQSVVPMDYAVGHLYGIDISDRSVECCTFVLLNYCLPSASARKISPWSAWHALRLNLAAADSLKLKIDRDSDHSGNRRDRDESRARLLCAGAGRDKLIVRKPEAGRRQLSLFGWEAESDTLIDLGRLFPKMSEGCDLLIGNPPQRADTELGSRLLHV